MNNSLTFARARQLTLCFCALCAVSAEAEIYKTVGPDGQVTYTDVPGGKKITEVDLPTINTQPSSQPKFYLPTEKLEAPIPDYKPAISSPTDNTDILADQRDLNVSASINTNLRKGDKLQLLLNGKPFGTAQETPSFLVKEIFRGEHQVSVAVVDERGRTISTSPSVTVNVHRPIVKRP